VRAVKRVTEELNAAGLKLNSDPLDQLPMATCSGSSESDLPHSPQDALQEIMGLTQGHAQKKDES
jgi:hypothetical protein